MSDEATTRQPGEEGLSYVEILDLRDQKNKHDIELAKQQTERDRLREESRLKEQRRTFIGSVLVGLALVTVALGILGAILLGVKISGENGVKNRLTDQQREQSCVQAGSTWIPGEVTAEGKGFCIGAGNAVPKS